MLCSLAIATIGGAACKKKQAAIAELTKADGPVDKQTGAAAWTAAPVGTAFFLGDAARTGDGLAQLRIVSGAQIAMQKHTILRFGGKTDGGGEARIAVEVGAIDLTGTGNYALDIGEVKLSQNGSVRITATGHGPSTVQLVIGKAEVSTLGGETIQLVVDKPVEVGLDVAVKPVPVAADAGVPVDAVVAVADAAVDAPADAGPPAPTSEATIAVDGKRAEIQLAGETKWTPLPAGAGELPKGAKIKLGPGTSAKLVSRGTTLELAGGSRVSIGEDESFVLEAGAGKASMRSESRVDLPGGSITMKGSEAEPAEARLDAGPRETKVSVTRGTGKLAGAPGTELAMSRGETAALLKAGSIRTIEAIPTYFDFRVSAGESFTIHDPKPPTAIQIQFGGKCGGGGIIELASNAQFRTSRVSGGKESANLAVQPGSWAYRLRCTSGASEGNAVAQGRISVVRDSGTRALPKNPPSNSIDADGRVWKISYQSQIPTLIVNYRGATGSSYKLHLAEGGSEQAFDATKPQVTIAGTKLKEGTYTYWFDKDGVKQDKVSTLKIDFDQTAPQVYIESPANGKPWAGDIDVRGAVLPGWTAAVDSVPIPIDGARRFAAKVDKPAGTALAIKLFHAKQGVHYYLRRAK